MIAITVADVRQQFREAGCQPPSKTRARAIVAALPNMALATGWSEAEVLEVCIENRANGAISRLLAGSGTKLEAVRES